MDARLDAPMIRAMAAAAHLYELPPVTHVDGLQDTLGQAWDAMYAGDLDAAEDHLAQAEAIVRSMRFDAGDRAEVLFRQGCVAFQRAHVGDAAALLTRALEVNARAPQPRASLAARAHEWRSRCHVHLRDWEAARRDVEHALDLAGACDDVEARANALFQASIVAERQRQWLIARCFAEQALELYRSLGNRRSEARVLNNLGGIAFLLGDVEAAELSLLAATECAADDADLAQAVNSLAQVYLHAGRAAEARARALRAVELLEERRDFLDELGGAELVVARTYHADGEPGAASAWLDRAEATFERFGSPGCLAAAWIARGDLAVGPKSVVPSGSPWRLGVSKPPVPRRMPDEVAR